MKEIGVQFSVEEKMTALEEFVRENGRLPKKDDDLFINQIKFDSSTFMCLLSAEISGLKSTFQLSGNQKTRAKRIFESIYYGIEQPASSPDNGKKVVEVAETQKPNWISRIAKFLTKQILHTCIYVCFL